MTDAWHHLPSTFDAQWVDIVLLAVLCISVLVGLWRGFVFEIVSLLGWVVAWVAANMGGPWLADKLLPGATQVLRFWVAYAVVFVLVLIVCTLLARLLRALISATPLTFVDRLLGGAFGVARGAFVLVIIGTLVTLSPYAHATWWRESQSALWIDQALEDLKPVLPQSFHGRMDT
ncbi:MAG TPA: CvpA family protein [Burkholderiaceae bacterium]|nr:CvpA family protein [Burkholderiaceae bacterium]